jgi:hypothetical protein
MSYKFTISTDNYSGYSGNITYYPSTGGTIDLGSVMLPYIYYTEYYYGQYIIDITEFEKICVLNYPPLNITPTVTPTNTQTPTVTPTVTPTEPLIPSICDVNYSIVVNKGEDCGLYIEESQIGCQLGALSAGSLLSSSGCTIGTYVVDWYLNEVIGSPSFTSGSAISASPDVTVVQPFYSEPAQGGTWYPVIRFVYLDGIQYTSDINLVDGIVKYSPDLNLNLTTISNTICVESYTCSSGVSGNTYPVTISYVNTTQNSTQAQRSISWDLSPITKNFAWAFKGFNVYDTISISYISPTNNINSQIENWKVGYDAGTNSLTSNPKVYSYGLSTTLGPDTLKLVTSLTGFTYTNGDYLLINMEPNPTNTNTNWGFSGKCLTDTASLDCGSIFNGNFVTGGYDVSNITSTYDISNCRLTISGLKRNSPIYTATTTNNNFFKYHGSKIESIGTQSMANGSCDLKVSASQGGTFVNSLCTNQISGTTITKVGSTITLTFDNITDYNVYKTQYNVATGSTLSNYINNPSNINYYKYLTIGVLSGTTCGDTLGVAYDYSTHISSPFIFDDLNKIITVVLSTGLNGYNSGTTCNGMYDSINQVINNINNEISEANYTFKTYVRRGNGINPYYSIGGRYYSTTFFPSHNSSSSSRITPKPNVCQSSMSGWLSTSNNFQWESYTYYIFYNVTDVTDPTNNFTITNRLDSNGSVVSPGTLIYEINNGVVIFPI